MEQQLAELQRRLIEAEAQAAEGQRLHQEEQHKARQAEARAEQEQRRREEEQHKSKQAEARAEQEQRRRKAAEANAKQSQPKNLLEYLETCHNFSLALQVVTDKTLTTQGDTTKPFGRLFPKRIVPWDDFPKQQRDVWEKLLTNTRFNSQRVFPSAHQLDYVQKYLDPISSENGLRHYARETVENPVRTLIEEVYRDEQLREQLQLRGTIIFESHTNLGQPSEKPIEEIVESMSITEPNTSKVTSERAKNKGKPANKGQQKGKQHSGSQRRAGTADQFCICELANGARVSIVSIEYKPPHKFPLVEITAGLKGEIRPAEDVINKEGDGFDFLSKSLVAAVVTQLFSYMVAKGVQWGYIFVGEAIIFLHISDDPSIVYYHLSIPRFDFQEDDENRFHRTSVAQVFAFVLGALAAEAPGQLWHDATMSLETWAVEYIDILKKIPVTAPKKRRGSLSYTAARWKGFLRSPIRTRSRGLAAACNPSVNDYVHDNSDESDDNDAPATPTPNRTTRQRIGQHELTPIVMSSSSKIGAGNENVKEAKSRPRIEDRPYCTQRCLFGLAYGGSMDQQCPNFQDHKGEHITQTEFLRCIYHQLATDRGHNADCKQLYIKGSRGALFKVRLSSYGYTLVAKGMQEHDRDHLLQESKVYDQLRSIQGRHVPVCLGIVDPKLPYYYDCGIYVTMLFLSWAGRSLYEFLSPDNEVRILEQAKSALRALHNLQVLHMDAEPRNMLWDKQEGNLMLIDFERAQIRARLPLSTITSNRKRNRQGAIKSAMNDEDYDREKKSALGWISRYIN